MIFCISYAEISLCYMRHTKTELIVLAEIAALVKSQIFKKTFFEQLATRGVGIDAALKHPFYQRARVADINLRRSSAFFRAVRIVKIGAAACDIRIFSQSGFQQHFQSIAVYPIITVNKKNTRRDFRLFRHCAPKRARRFLC